MKEQKNIERLFQEKFKDFEVVPPEMVWKNIERKLNEKKKKRRVIPFWFKATGIAASLLLGFYLYSYFNITKISIKPENTTVEKNINSIKNKNQEDKNKINNSAEVIFNNSEKVVSTEKKKSSNKLNNKESEKNSDVFLFKEKNSSIKTSRNLLTFSKDYNKTEGLNQTINDEKIIQDENESELVILEKNNTQKETPKLFENKVDFEKINRVFNDNTSAVKVVKSTDNKTQDSSLVAKISEEINALEQLLKEKEVGKNVEEKEKEMQNRWAVSSNASPVYFNSSSKGSPLDTRFESNQKNYNNSLSYGLGVSYAINDKISLRTGINTVNLNYNTSEVVFYQDANAKEIQNVTRNQRGSLINIDNKGTIASSTTEINLFGNDVKKYDGELNQQMGYLEIPLELSYKVLDKKIGIDLIGGMSTLLLNRNDVSLISDSGMEMTIGEPNNLNNIHFSSNVGVSFKYLFLKSFEANFNPMFKYQLNTYSENSGNFKPYFIGLYTGLAYKF